jgi:hypothetical protein
MTAWRAAGCLLELKQQLDAAYPDRPRDSDGFIASAAHHSQNPTSDHEARPDPNDPDGPWVVLAFDITTSPLSPQLAEDLRLMGVHHDRRIKYVIWDQRIATARDNYAWRPYTPQTQGHWVDPHTNHIHVSVINDPDVYDSHAPWPVLGLAPAHTTVPPLLVDQETDMVIIYATGKPTALFTGTELVSLKSNTEKDALTAAGITVKHLTPDEFTLIQKVVAR